MTTVVNINLGGVYDVYCGRGSKWGNPWTSKKKGKTLAVNIVNTRDEACDLHEKWLTEGEGIHLLKDLYELKDKVLGCFCSPLRCHCDTLARLADALPERKEPKFTVDKLLGSKK